MKILVINGPNINLLGIREPEIYGKENYKSLILKIKRKAKERKVKVKFFQSNHEGKIVDKIQKARNRFDGILINPAAFSHTSVALLDALKAVNLPVAEVHISDVAKREEFRQTDYVSEIAIKTVCGKGTDGYTQALDYLLDYLEK